MLAARRCESANGVQSPHPRSALVNCRWAPACPQLGEAHLLWACGLRYMNAALSVYQQSPRSSERSWRKRVKNVEPVLCGAKSTMAGGRPLSMTSTPHGTRRGSEGRAMPPSTTCAGTARRTDQCDVSSATSLSCTTDAIGGSGRGGGGGAGGSVSGIGGG